MYGTFVPGSESTWEWRRFVVSMGGRKAKVEAPYRIDPHCHQENYCSPSGYYLTVIVTSRGVITIARLSCLIACSLRQTQLN